MENYPGNRQRDIPAQAPEPEKKIEKVIEGEVIRRKKPLGRRISETFVKGDAQSVGQYVMFEVLLPALKDTIADVTSQGVERMLFGEARSTSRRTGRRPGTNPYVQYDRFSSQNDRGRKQEKEYPSRRARASHDFDEIILATRAEAEEVISRLFDLVSKYDTASVRDLYELVGAEARFTDDKWGWTDLRGSGVTRVRGGYLLDLPPTEPLD